MWSNIKAKMSALVGTIKGSNPSASTGAAKIEVKHVLYAAIILLPVVVGLSAFYGTVSTQAKLEAANLPENRFARMGVNFTAEEFVKYAGRGNIEITANFIEAGMSANSYRKSDGFTPLHAAAAYGKADVAQQLLDKGADINSQDKEGQTPLMKAVWNNHAGVVAVLTQHGANTDVRDLRGNTIITMAQTRNDKSVLTALVQAGVFELKGALDQTAPATTKDSQGQNTGEVMQKSGDVSANNGKAARPVALTRVPTGEFALDTGYAGGIGIGQPAASLYQHFGQQAVSAGVEYIGGRAYSVLRVYDQGAGGPVLTAFVSSEKEGEPQTITAIRVLDSRYKTAGGIGVDGTLGELRQTGSIRSIEYTDSLYAVVPSSKMSYEIGISADNVPVAWLNGGSTNSLSDAMRIKSIFLF